MGFWDELVEQAEVGKFDFDSTKTVRVVTFQSRDILNSILSNGMKESTSRLGGSIPYGINRLDRSVRYARLNGDKIVTLHDDKTDEELAYEIHHAERAEQIYPFYAYSKHRYCGDMLPMSIFTLYKLSSHFFGSECYDGRDIIELDVPVDDILISRSGNDFEEVLLPYIKKEWIVSVLKFEDYITEPVHHEQALLYKNKVMKYNTYRMCYSNDVVFNGHGHGDCLECMLSPIILTSITDTSICRYYVQPELWKLFAKYLYIIRHGLPVSSICDVKLQSVYAELPTNIDISLIKSFGDCKRDLLDRYNVRVFDNNLSYRDRLACIYLKRESQDSNDTTYFVVNIIMDENEEFIKDMAPIFGKCSKRRYPNQPKFVRNVMYHLHYSVNGKHTKKQIVDMIPEDLRKKYGIEYTNSMLLLEDK